MPVESGDDAAGANGPARVGCVYRPQLAPERLASVAQDDLKLTGEVAILNPTCEREGDVVILGGRVCERNLERARKRARSSELFLRQVRDDLHNQWFVFGLERSSHSALYFCEKNVGNSDVVSDDAQAAHKTPGLRLHGHAAPGSGMAFSGSARIA